MTILRHIRICTALVYTIILLSGALSISLLTIQYFAIPIWHRTAKMWGKGCLWLMGISILEENESTFPKQGPRIIMYNHESILDLLWLCAISPPAFSSVTKNLFRFIPLLNIAFWASGQIFIDRRNRKTSVEALKKLVVRVHKQKRTVLISPEGTRTTTGELLPFKKGGFYMAIEGQLPIHLVVIDGPFSLMPPGYASPLPGVLKLRYLPVIDTTTWKKETIPDHMTYVREIMRTSLIELRQAKKNQVLY